MSPDIGGRALAAGPSTAPVAVLPFPTGGAATVADVARIRQAVRASLEENGLQMMAIAEVDRLLLATDNPTCTEPRCLAHIATALKVSQLVGGRLERREAKVGPPGKASWTLGLWLFDAGQRAIAATTHDTCAECNKDEAAAWADKVAARLLQREAHAAAASALLTIRSIPQGARVKIDGTAVGVADMEYTVPPGRHTLQLELDGYPAKTLAVAVEPRTQQLIEVTMGETAPTEPTGTRDRSPALTIGKWVALGAGAAALATGIALIAIDGRPTCDRPFGDERCPDRYSTLGGGVTLTVIGALAAGTSGLLFYLDSRTHSEARPVRGGLDPALQRALVPWVASRSGGLSALFAF